VKKKTYQVQVDMTDGSVREFQLQSTPEMIALDIERTMGEDWSRVASYGWTTRNGGLLGRLLGGRK